MYGDPAHSAKRTSASSMAAPPRVDVVNPTAMRNAVAAAELFAGLAARCTDVVMSPGSRNTPLVLAARARPDLRLHIVLDERAAAFVALGLARQTGRPVALVCTSGSAGTHYLPAICEAHHSAIPLVAITADRPPELHACGAPQTMPQAGLFGRFVRHERTLFDLEPTAWRHAGLVAVDAASQTPAGPVHLNVVLREPLWQSGVDVAVPPAARPSRLGGLHLDGAALDALAARISGLADGVIFCGADQGGGRAGDGAIALANATGWPLLAAATSGVRWCGGQAGIAPIVGAFDGIVRAGSLPPPSLVVQVGAAPLSQPVLRWLAAAKQTVRIDVNGVRRDPLLAGGELVTADPRATLLGLAARVTRSDTTWGPLWRELESAAQQVVQAAADELAEVGVARAVAAAVPTDTPLVIAASMPSRDVDAFAAPRSDGPAAFGNRGLNGIDGLIATAAGHALSAGRATLLCGDLAFLHDVGGLLAARALGVQLDIVVVDNGGGGIFAQLPIHAHADAFEPCFLTPQPTRIAAIAGGAGCDVQHIEAISALASALTTPGRGVRVLVVAVDRAASAQHRDRTRAALATAVQTIMNNRSAALPAAAAAPPKEQP